LGKGRGAFLILDFRKDLLLLPLLLIYHYYCFYCFYYYHCYYDTSAIKITGMKVKI
jgi:hypothetical protein